MFLSTNSPVSSSLFPTITTHAKPLELASSSCLPRLFPFMPISLRTPAPLRDATVASALSASPGSV